MISIKTIDFNEESVATLKAYKYGSNWPVTYIINNDDKVYIGETINACMRSNQHLADEVRRSLKKISIISDSDFNKSVALDLESFLIKYMSADKKYELQNKNTDLKAHNYYDKKEYESKFRLLWRKLKNKGLVTNDLREIENSDLFKYSPYKSLNTDQYMAVNNVLEELSNDIKNGILSTTIINGGAGTGKTILAIYLIKLLVDAKSSKIIVEDDDVDMVLCDILKINEIAEDMKIALVIPMNSLRKTLKKVFRDIPGLKPSMVISPNDVVKSEYDLLVVDEAHRLRRRRNITNYGTFDSNNKLLGLDNDGTELDWILKRSKYQILFYDSNQTIKPTDVREDSFYELSLKRNIHFHKLQSQLRCNGGDDYVEYIKSIFSDDPPKEKESIKNYELKMFDDVNDMVEAIKEKEKKYLLCRVVAGYAWKWTKGSETSLCTYKNTNNTACDIVIDQYGYIWNTEAEDWVNSDNSIDEIGCIHTIQGYDLNYAGVIIGEDLKYDEKKGFYVDKSNYKDQKGKAAIETEEELLSYIKNIYVTLLTRGIYGTYIYVCDPELRKYLKNYIKKSSKKMQNDN